MDKRKRVNELSTNKNKIRKSKDASSVSFDTPLGIYYFYSKKLQKIQ